MHSDNSETAELLVNEGVDARLCLSVCLYVFLKTRNSLVGQRLRGPPNNSKYDDI